MSSHPETHTFTARWVFPVAGPPLANGTITVRGDVIESVDQHGLRMPDEDLGNAAIVPGLVNPHTHLDLSGARGLIPPTDPDHFTDWLRDVIAYRRSRTPEQVQADIRVGLAECMRYGTTLIGDIAAEGASWDAVSEANLRGEVYFEQIGLSEERARITGKKAWEWYQAHPPNKTCKPAFSPHSPYSARSSLLIGATSEEWTLSIHLAETSGELELISNHTGPFVPFLKDLNVWDESGFIRGIEAVISRNRHSGRLFIHCNYLGPNIAKYFHAGMSIVYCPRTHAAFRHPSHPFREFLQRGVRVCLGTDSLASNPDLDILAEARFVHAKYPNFPGDALLKMITLSGAEALGWANETGSLEPGKSADFVAVPLPDRDAVDPHALLFADHPGERRTMFQGVYRGEPAT